MSESSLPPPITPAAGFVDARHRGRLQLHGRDAAQFLHALVSNDVARLTAGSGCYAVWLTPQGRLITDMRIYHCGDHVLLDVPAGLAAQLATRLDQLVFAEDVRVVDASQTMSAIAVYGEDAASRLGRAFGFVADDLTSLDTYAHREVSGVRIARTDDAIAPSFTVFVPADRYDPAIRALVDAGLNALGADAADALRIEAGHPAFGVDMNEDTIPLEAGLGDRAISMTKGCYVGQEVIVRILHRGGGRVVKRLVQLRFDETATPPPAGTLVMCEDREVGRITSVATISRNGEARVIALGYVHRDVAEIGTRVSANSVGAIIVGFAG